MSHTGWELSRSEPAVSSKQNKVVPRKSADKKDQPKMKSITAIITALFMLGSVAIVSAESCCDKAKKEGKECEHACCKAAKKEGKVCEKCNKTEKKEDKKK